MKIKSYLPRFYAIFLILIAIAYSILGYILINEGLYFGLIVLLLIAIAYINCISLYDDKIVILQFYEIIKFKFDLIDRIELGYYRESLPCIFFYFKKSKSKKLFYKFYTNEASIEIIKYALKKNNNIEIDAKVKAFIGSDL